MIKLENKMLTFVEKDILKFLTENLEQFLNYSTTEIAKFCNTTPTTVTRFVKKVGYDSLKDLKAELEQNLKNKISIEYINENISRIQFKNLQSLKKTLKINNINKCVEKINNCNRMILYGAGSSYSPIYEFTSNLQKIGLNAICSEGFHRTITNLSFLKEMLNSLVFIISTTGKSNEVIELIKYCQENNIFCILITSNKNIKSTNNLLVIYFDEQKSLIKITNTSSIVSQYYIIDVIFTFLVYSDKKFCNYWVNSQKNLLKAKFNF